MKYVWESVGDQDECLRKVCCLGPYKLEHAEDHWADTGKKDEFGESIELLMMVSRIYLWDNSKKKYELVEKLPPVEYDVKKSHKNAEDWYALHVLSEELMIGTVQKS